MKTLFSFLTAIFLAVPQLHARVNVVATLPDIGAIVSVVGGDKIKLTTLARPSEDPHFVDAKPSFVRVLNQADLLVEGGAELEAGWLPPLLSGARNAKVQPGAPGRLPLSPAMRLLEVPSGPVDRSQGDVHPAGNPHFLLDPLNGKRAAEKIAEALGKLDSGNADFYTTNARRFGAQVDEKLAGWEKALAPFRGTKVVTYHRTYSYLLNRFGFDLAATVEPKPGIEPSPTYIRDLVAQMKTAGVKLVLAEPNRPRKTAEYVAENSGAKLLILPIAPGANEKVPDYFAVFDHAVAQIVGALKP